MRKRHPSLTVALAVALGAVAVGAGACGLGSLGASSSALGPCPSALTRTHRFIAVTTDSPAERSASVQNARLEAIGGFAREAAACRGTLAVVFDPGQSRARVLWQGQAFVPAATAIATDRRSATLIADTVMPAVHRALEASLATPAPRFASPVDAFQVVADDNEGTTGPVAALVLSAFVEEDGVVNLDVPLDTAQATTLASHESVPALHDTTVTIEGVGETSDAVSAPASWLTALRRFAQGACTKTGARGCVVTTQVRT